MTEHEEEIAATAARARYAVHRAKESAERAMLADSRVQGNEQTHKASIRAEFQHGCAVEHSRAAQDFAKDGLKIATEVAAEQAERDAELAEQEAQTAELAEAIAHAETAERHAEAALVKSLHEDEAIRHAHSARRHAEKAEKDPEQARFRAAAARAHAAAAWAHEIASTMDPEAIETNARMLYYASARAAAWTATLEAMRANQAALSGEYVGVEQCANAAVKAAKQAVRASEGEMQTP